MDKLEDPARGGYFTVEDLRGGHGDVEFNVRAYDRRGELLLHTWHTTEGSMQIECDVWRRRGAFERSFADSQTSAR
jgi:hypothetical protein